MHFLFFFFGIRMFSSDLGHRSQAGPRPTATGREAREHLEFIAVGERDCQRFIGSSSVSAELNTDGYILGLGSGIGGGGRDGGGLFTQEEFGK